MNNKSTSWLILILLAFIWGSSYILMKKAMIANDGSHLLSANQVGSLRVIIAALVILPFIFKHIRFLFSKEWIWFFLVGLLGNFLPAYLFTHAEQDLSSSFTGILNSLVPVFSLLFSLVLFKNKINSKGIIGVFIGLIGAVLLILFKEGDIISKNNFAIIYVISATICYAISLNIIKEKLNHVNSIVITGISLTFMLPCALIIYFLEPQSTVIFESKYSEALLYTSILAIFGTTIALILFNKLIKISSSLFASSVTYLIPFVAILWGWFFNETIGWSVLFIFVIISGIYLVKQGSD